MPDYKSIFLVSIALLIMGPFAMGQTGKSTTSDVLQDVNLEFFDTTLTYSTTMKVHYSSTDKSYVVYIDQSDSTHKFTVYEPLDYSVVRVRLDSAVRSKYSVTNPLTQFTELTIYGIIYSINHADGDAPLAGTLFLSNNVVVVSDKNYKEYGGRKKYMDRMQLVDSLEATIKKSQNERDAARDSIANILTEISGVLNKKTKDNNKKRIDTLIRYNTSNTFDKILPALKRIVSPIVLDTASVMAKDTAGMTANTTPRDTAGLIKRYTTWVTDTLLAALPGIDSSAISKQKLLNAAEKSFQADEVYKVEHVSIQFETGFIERIQISIKYKNTSQIFENTFAIGFSSIKNYKDFTSIVLFSRNLYESDGKYQPYVYLSDVLKNYDNFNDVYTRDYSPADTAFNDVDPEQSSSLVLHKERVSELFESKIYTDLWGIGNNSPNGLVQIELSKSINLLTHRHQIKHVIPRCDYGFLNYLELWGDANKIEDKQRYMTLSNQDIVVGGKLVSPYYATNIDLMRYKNASIGFDVNAFLFDAPDAKMTAYLDFGFQYSYTPAQAYNRTIDSVHNTAIIDTTFQHFDGNAFSLFLPELTLQFFPEKRFNIWLHYQFNYTWLFSNDFKQVMSYEKDILNQQVPFIPRTARESHMLELYITLQTGKDVNSKVFFRSRFYLQQGDVNTFYPTLELGYTYKLSIIKNK